LGFKSAEHAEKVASQITSINIAWLLQWLWLFWLLQVRIDREIPESTWVNHRDSIANEIRELGAGYRQKLRDGWVQYLLAGSTGQSARRVDVGVREKRVVPWYVASIAGSRRDSQAVIFAGERQPSPSCSMRRLLRMKQTTNLLLAHKPNNHK
jgi:hypothetical protein